MTPLDNDFKSPLARALADLCRAAEEYDTAELGDTDDVLYRAGALLDAGSAYARAKRETT